METSAKTGFGIEEVFQTIGKNILDKVVLRKEVSPSVSVSRKCSLCNFL